MGKETMLGKKIKEDFSNKKCCNVCDFPVDIPREPIFIKESVLSLLEYEENTCKSCSHQKDGSTILAVNQLINKIVNKYIKEREDLIKFLKHYTCLTKEERKEVCVAIPRFLNKDYNTKNESYEDGNIDEPYSWDVVYNEIINDTKLAKVLVRELQYKNTELGFLK